MAEAQSLPSGVIYLASSIFGKFLTGILKSTRLTRLARQIIKEIPQMTPAPENYSSSLKKRDTSRLLNDLIFENI